MQNKRRLFSKHANFIDMLSLICKKKAPEFGALYISTKNLFFPVFHVFAVTGHKLVNTSGAVNQCNFTSVKRMR